MTTGPIARPVTRSVQRTGRSRNVARRVHGALHIVADDPTALAAGRHRARIGIRQRDLLSSLAIIEHSGRGRHSVCLVLALRLAAGEAWALATGTRSRIADPPILRCSFACACGRHPCVVRHAWTAIKSGKKLEDFLIPGAAASKANGGKKAKSARPCVLAPAHAGLENVVLVTHQLAHVHGRGVVRNSGRKGGEGTGRGSAQPCASRGTQRTVAPELRTFARRAVAAEMELMEMSCRRPGEAWSLPAIAARVLAFSARRNGAEKLSRCGDRFRQQAV
jgi:hypothetical protein